MCVCVVCCVCVLCVLCVCVLCVCAVCVCVLCVCVCVVCVLNRKRQIYQFGEVDKFVETCVKEFDLLDEAVIAKTLKWFTTQYAPPTLFCCYSNICTTCHHHHTIWAFITHHTHL